jgi:hypothetical protein
LVHPQVLQDTNVNVLTGVGSLTKAWVGLDQE